MNTSGAIITSIPNASNAIITNTSNTSIGSIIGTDLFINNTNINTINSVNLTYGTLITYSGNINQAIINIGNVTHDFGSISELVMSKNYSNYEISAETQNCFNLSNLTGTVSSISLETYNIPSAVTYDLGKNQFGLNTIADSVINTITINGVTSGINLTGNVSIDTLNIFNHCNFLTTQNNSSINITSATINSATIKLVDHSYFGYFYAEFRQ